MQSKNKRAQTAAEAAHVARLAELPCSVCSSLGKQEIHELKQGQWFTAIPLCHDCHRGAENGWHGRRGMWKLYKMDEVDALNVALRRLLS